MTKSALRATLLAAILLAGGAHAAEEPAPVVTVRAAPLVRQVVSVTVGGYGTLTPDSDALVNVSFQRAGQVARVLVRPGQPVARSTPLVDLATDPTAAAGYAKARSALTFATGELERARALRDQHLATNSQVAAAEQAERDARSALEAEQRLGTDHTTETLAAPFDGYVDSIPVALGDRIQPGAPVVRLGRGAGVRVVAGVDPTKITAVKVGQPVTVTPLLGTGAALNGTVAGIAGMLNPTTRLVDVTVVLEAGSGALPGTPARIAVITDRHDGYVVPRQAVLTDAEGAYLFQVAGAKARRVGVETGVEGPAGTEVSGDTLDPKLPVIILGNYGLEDGAVVKVEAAR
ncbi:efflux RND transporter periplasmic adaptor subunit [Nitrospirillum sp. BR 11163]|uniref:efflux RND transporter periplasmic adaptor subunit n=1 Tax=Nitrospirillum sp. BR 11163 TaxID=3104323 RepID=UPI002B00392D|nr:efflux RND transporter periplasmic adaptor subunit [Nitrospirillum sp. BR 11163]MEA1671809.1 efflux RND transporter periplasmic adaptor subunit [Nitrospirillum sp. BR 11163]